MLQYKFAVGRGSVIVEGGEGLMAIPWTDTPDSSPSVSANQDFQRLKAQVDAGEIVIADPDPPSE